MQEITFEVRSFLRENIQSVWQLDLLIAIMNIKEPVDANMLARLLYSSPTSIESALHKFVKAGIVTEIPGRPSTFLYAPATSTKQQVIENAAKTYAIRRVDVINLIFSNPSKQGLNRISDL
jgi:predicted transcriptional regulator